MVHNIFSRIFNKPHKSTSKPVKTISLTEPTIQEMVSKVFLRNHIFLNMFCCVLKNFIWSFLLRLLEKLTWFSFTYVAISSFYQVADEFQCLQRTCSRQLRKINFQLNRTFDIERKVTRRERYNNISRRYQTAKPTVPSKKKSENSKHLKACRLDVRHK